MVNVFKQSGHKLVVYKVSKKQDNLSIPLKSVIVELQQEEVVCRYFPKAIFRSGSFKDPMDFEKQYFAQDWSKGSVIQSLYDKIIWSDILTISGKYVDGRTLYRCNSVHFMCSVMYV